MKNLFFTFIALSLISTLALAKKPQCTEMLEAATALAKVNGGTFASPVHQMPEDPSLRDQVQDYQASYEVMYSPGDEVPNRIIGVIHVKAQIKTGESKCKVTKLAYSE